MTRRENELAKIACSICMGATVGTVFIAGMYLSAAIIFLAWCLYGVLLIDSCMMDFREMLRGARSSTGQGGE